LNLTSAIDDSFEGCQVEAILVYRAIGDFWNAGAIIAQKIVANDSTAPPYLCTPLTLFFTVIWNDSTDDIVLVISKSGSTPEKCFYR
jgi:hypothetical protein